MSHQTDSSRNQEESRIDWVGGIITSMIFATLVASLYFVVPKLVVSWKNRGILPPFYGRMLITMTQHFFLVVLVGSILVGLSFRRRA